MARSERVVERPGAGAAAVTAASVVAFWIVADVVRWSVALLGATAGRLDAVLLASALVAVPFGLGYFVSLWIVGPIAHPLRVGHVITRSILAVGIGATVVFIVLGIIAIVGGVAALVSLIAGGGAVTSFPDSIAVALGAALQRALTVLVTQLPLGVLAGVLLWVWRREHPARREVSGLIDL